MSIFRNSIFGLAGSALPGLSALICIPLLIDNTTSNIFGSFIVLLSITSLAPICDLGAGRMLTIAIPKIATRQNRQTLKITYSGGLLLAIAGGIIGGGLLIIASQAISRWILVGTDVSYAAAKTSIYILAPSIPMISSINAIRGGLEGQNRFFLSNLSRAIGGSLALGMPTILVLSHLDDIRILSAAIVASRLIVLITLVPSMAPYVSSQTPQRSIKSAMNIVQKSRWLFVSSVAGPIILYSDRFIISSTIGAAQLQYYYTPQELLMKSAIIPAAFSGAILPWLAARRSDEIHTIFARVNCMYSIIVLLFALVTAASLPFVLSEWIGHEFASRALSAAEIITIGVAANSLAQPIYSKLHAQQKMKITAIIHLAELFIFIPLAVALTLHLKVTGAAIAWTLRCLVDYLSLYTADQLTAPPQTRASIEPKTEIEA